MWGPKAKISSSRSWVRPPDSHLCTRVLTWLEPRMLFCVVIVLTCFSWSLSFLSWGGGGGETWRGYAATCTDLPTVDGRLGYKAFRHVSSHHVALYRPVLPLTTFPGGGGSRPLELVICLGVDHTGPW
jgi:hypothetical protein